MSEFMDLHLDNVQDPEPVPGGEQYQLRIGKAEMKRNEKDTRNMIVIMFSIVDNPTAPPIMEYLNLPCKEDAENTVYMFKLRIKDFCRSFNIELGNEPDFSEWKGLEGWAFIKTEEYKGKPQNKVSKFIFEE